MGMRGAGRFAGLCVGALALIVLACPPAHGADWRERQLAVFASPLHSSLHGISCPTESLCVTVGEEGVVASSTNPTGDAAEWKVVRPYDPAAEADECRFVQDGIGEPEIQCPGGLPLNRQVRAVSCPTASFCVAVTYDGYAYSSTDPTGGAASWRVADLDGSGRDTHLESVSCPDPGFCVAVSGNRDTAGKVLTSTAPSGPGSAWVETQLDPSLDLRGVSCTSRTFCIAVAHQGRILKSTNPAGGASAWEEIGTPAGPGNLEAIDCLDAGSFLCVTGNAGGNLLTTTAPSAAASTWSETNGGASVQVTGVSCPSPARCLAVDNNGNVQASGDPTRAGSWSSTNLIPFTPPQPNQPPLNALFDASCPTTALCALVGTRGRIFSSTDPFAAAAPPSGPRKRRLIKRPRTTLLKADRFREYTRHRRLKVRFRFYANAKVRGFLCKRDRGPYRRCRSPLRYWVPLGRHVLRVRAIGVTGLRGPVAMIRFEALRNPRLD
jgi:hypothetical protein